MLEQIDYYLHSFTPELQAIILSKCLLNRSDD